jgi:hypothetical protein
MVIMTFGNHAAAATASCLLPLPPTLVQMRRLVRGKATTNNLRTILWQVVPTKKMDFQK